MGNILGPTVRFSFLPLLALAAGLPAGAGVIQPTTTLPPAAGVFSLPPVCIIPVCLGNISVSGFQRTSDIFSAGNELVSTTAIFSASIFENTGGSPGLPVGALSLGGTVDFTFFGRTPSTLLGSFNSQITSFEFAGLFNAHPFALRQNHSLATTGITTISQAGSQYQITSFFDIFAELQLNGQGPFVAGPPRHVTVEAVVPEPAVGRLAALGLGAAILAAARRRRRTS